MIEKITLTDPEASESFNAIMKDEEKAFELSQHIRQFLEEFWAFDSVKCDYASYLPTMVSTLFPYTESEADELRAQASLLENLRTFVFNKSNELGLKLDKLDQVRFEISSKEHIDKNYQGDYWRYFR